MVQDVLQNYRMRRRYPGEHSEENHKKCDQHRLYPHRLQTGRKSGHSAIFPRSLDKTELTIGQKGQIGD
jgi:hypothetical protein